MAEELLDKLRDVVEGQIDFEGQRRAEGFATLFLALTGLIAFNVGYVLQDIVKCVYVGLGGTVLTFLVVIPPWPFYNRNPVKWLPAGSAFNTGGT
ncbi:microsomal signal peptidase 12 kDa subunit domain-containing protein [Trichoderma gracile]